MKQLRDMWADARRQLEESIRTATGAADTVRIGLENAFGDLRKALLESKNKAGLSYRPLAPLPVPPLARQTTHTGRGPALTAT